MRWSVSTKILLTLTGVLLVFASVAIYSIVTLGVVGRDLELVDRSFVPLARLAAELGALASKSHLDLRELTSVRDPRSLRILGQIYPRSINERVSKLLERGDALVADALATRLAEHERSFFERAKVRLSRVRAEHRDNVVELSAFLRDIAGPSPPDAVAVRERLRRRDGVIRAAVMALTTELDERMTGTVLGVRREQRTGAWMVMAILVLAAALGLLLALYAHLTLRPIGKLTEAVKDIARGDYSGRVQRESQDEIGVLATAFNQMAASLKEREQRLAEQQRELEDAYLKLVKSERLAAVGRIAAQITHEIRNPLSSIGLNADLLSEELGRLAGGSDAAEATGLLRSIAREVDRLTEVTEGYLRFARLPKPRLEAEDIGPLLADLLAFTREELTARGIETRLTLAPGLPEVRADDNQLRQAMLNLVRNAVEAMPSGGVLAVDAAARDVAGRRWVEVSVRDSGVGISAEASARVFDPFFSTKAGGTGLGLALTQQIVGEHGGELTFESEPGVGTTFRLRLPAVEPPTRGG